MSREKEIKWLYRELPVLIEQNVLTEEAASKLKNYYGPEPERKGANLAFIITAVLGSVLIGAGIILVFAHNWEELSRTWRTVFSFLPLLIAQLIYGYAFFKKKESIAWSESTSALVMLMMASTIALISQSYNMGGTFEDFILTCMILSVPLMYLTNSSLVYIFYITGISYWCIATNYLDSYWYLALLAVALPHFVLNINTHATTIRGNILGWTTAISLFATSFKLIGRWDEVFIMYYHALVFTIVYLIGKIIYKHGSNIFARPFQSTGLLTVFTYSLFFSYTWRGYYYYYEKHEIEWFSYLVLIGLVGVICALVVYNFIKKNGVNYFVIAYPVLFFISDLLARNDMAHLSIVIFNVYVLAFGVYYIWWGIRSEQISFVNAGMFLVSGLLVMRFFDQDISFVVKGVIFILIGVCFLLINLVLAKKLKAKHGKEKN